MRGLSYPPVLENEVLVLFGVLIPHLDDQFVIEEFNSSPGFPDCFALRNGKEVGIEFEVNSKHFFEHKHHLDPNLRKCNIIVCWKNVLEPVIHVIDKHGKEHQIEILELEKVVKDKSLFSLFPLKKQQPPDEWSETQFFEELKKKAGEGNTYNWIRELIQTCKKYEPEFIVAYGKGKRQATIGFQIRKWLSQGIGVPTPILFSDNGDISFDCANMHRIPAIEKELRNRIGQIRTKKWGRWCSIPIRDEKTFKTLKEIIKWLAQTIPTPKEELKT